MINRDGSFNVTRHGMPVWDFLHPYHRLLRISWIAFFALVAGSYVAINLLFAWAYLLCGPGALEGAGTASESGSFADAFFFSVQTLATIGYGKITPSGLAANLVVAAEALAGALSFALITGILFARFSRPTARIAFSQTAIVAPYRDGRALMFRIANARSNELTDVRATVSLGMFEYRNGKRVRRFHQLALERDQVTFLPTQWVIVHPIDAQSPLAQSTKGSLEEADAEVVILLSGTDETFSQTVQTRSSYKHYEINWGARFRDIQILDGGGHVTLDVRRLHEWEPAELPALSEKESI